MPTYSYYCEHCECIFEHFFRMSEYHEQIECDICRHTISRCYQEDIPSVGASVKKADSELKTLGDLANRNRDRMSEDHKAALYKKHNSYKETEPTKELPKGMSRMSKPKFKTKWTQS